jgi:hypothetical protein
MTPLAAATLRYHMSQLDSPDAQVRLRAGVEVCRLCGVLDAVRALAPDGSLNPPPAWPLVDVVPESARTDASGQWLIARVRTSVGGAVLHEDVAVRVPLRDGALMDAVERGRRGLGARMDGMVVR